MSNFISFSGQVAEDFRDILERIAELRGRDLDNSDKSKILEDALSIGLNSIGMIMDRALNEVSGEYEYFYKFTQEDFMYEISDHYPVILRASGFEEFLEQRNSECLKCFLLTGNPALENFSGEAELKKKSGGKKKKRAPEKKEKKEEKKDSEKGKKKKKRDNDVE